MTPAEFEYQYAAWLALAVGWGRLALEEPDNAEYCRMKMDDVYVRLLAMLPEAEKEAEDETQTT